MPFVKYQLFVLLCKLLSLGQVAQFETVGFPEFHTIRNLEDRFGACFDHVDMDRFMVVAVETKPKSVLFEDFWH